MANHSYEKESKTFNLNDTLESLRKFLDDTLAEYGLKQEAVEEAIAANTDSDGKVRMVPAVKAVRKLTLPAEFLENERLAQVLRDRGYDVNYLGDSPRLLMGLKDSVWVVKVFLMLRALENTK